MSGAGSGGCRTVMSYVVGGVVDHRGDVANDGGMMVGQERVPEDVQGREPGCEGRDRGRKGGRRALEGDD